MNTGTGRRGRERFREGRERNPEMLWVFFRALRVIFASFASGCPN